MKYRIKIVTYQNGRKEYFSQVKKWYGWINVGWDGNEILVESPADTRERALGKIDRHFNGNTDSQTIEFEYISK